MEMKLSINLCLNNLLFRIIIIRESNHISNLVTAYYNGVFQMVEQV
jgi:hypothetical protein